MSHPLRSWRLVHGRLLYQALCLHDANSSAASVPDNPTFSKIHASVMEMLQDAIFGRHVVTRSIGMPLSIFPRILHKPLLGCFTSCIRKHLLGFSHICTQCHGLRKEASHRMRRLCCHTAAVLSLIPRLWQATHFGTSQRDLAACQ